MILNTKFNRFNLNNTLYKVIKVQINNTIKYYLLAIEIISLVVQLYLFIIHICFCTLGGLHK